MCDNLKTRITELEEAGQAVVLCWEKGDLAGAVRNLATVLYNPVEYTPALTDGQLRDWDVARAYYGLDDSFLYADSAILEYVELYRSTPAWRAQNNF